MRRQRPSSHLRRAALLGLAAAAAAHLPPLHLAQRINGKLLAAWSTLFRQPEAEIAIVDLERPGTVAALTTLDPSEPATAIGSSLVALGPLFASGWIETGAWALGLAALIGCVVRVARPAPWPSLLGLGGAGALVTGSAATFAVGTVWVPVAGPSLMLVAAGGLALLKPKRSVAAQAGPVVRPETAEAHLGRGDLVAAWRRYRELPPSEALLPALHRLGGELESKGFQRLASDIYLRIATVDPGFEDITARLVRTSRPGHLDDAAELEALLAQMPPRLGRYGLLQPIARGTTGRVYLARDPHINRLVAIKRIDMTAERDETEAADAAERFWREAETAGRLSHENIVRIYDMDESDGIAYIAMEYLKGDLLSRFTAEETLLPPRLVLELGALTADALDYAHGQNVIHRDIKPGNIMYDSIIGDLKITDFGIARLIDVNRTRTGVVLGTPSFMSPEQIEGGNVNRHTDLFALGVSLYELLTGLLPFRGPSMTDLMFVIANEPHEPVTAARPDLPGAIGTVIDTALDKDPAARYQRGAEMAEALRVVANRMA